MKPAGMRAFVVNLSPESYERMRITAAHRGESMAVWVRELIEANSLPLDAAPKKSAPRKKSPKNPG